MQTKRVNNKIINVFPTNRKSQFYLMAAIIILGIVLTSVAAVNYIKTKKEKYPIYNIGDVVNFETAKVLDNGIATQNSNIDDLMLKWVTNYTNYQEGSISGDWLFIYGTKDDLKALIINQSTSGSYGFDLGTGGSVTSTQLTPYIFKITGLPSSINSDGKLKVEVGENTLLFDVKEGQNFYFVITTGNQTVSNQ